jgi:hypothetical protein
MVNPSSPPPPLPPAQAPSRIGDDVGMRMLIPVGRSGWAIAAGYLGLFGMVLVPAPLALIVSIVAILDIRKSRNSSTPKYGMGRAIFGLIVGVIGTISLIILVIQAISHN